MQTLLNHEWLPIFLMVAAVTFAYLIVPGFHGYFQMLLLISILVIAHELGHFWVAKRCGVKVERFGFGLPIGPAIWQKQVGETTYCLHPVLLGGYVSFPDDEPDNDLPKDSPRRFENQPVLNRAAIAIAGVTVNFILGYVFMLIVLLGWGEPDVLVKVHEFVSPNTPAATAGFQPDDVFLKMDGQRVSFTRFDEYKAYLEAHKNQPVHFTVKRGDQIVALTASPNAEGILGFVPAVQYMFVPLDNPLQGVVRAYTFLYEKMEQQFHAIGRIVQGDETLKQSLSGPIGIVKEGGDYISQFGFPFGLMISALLSVMLAIINILPVPMLDGGHLLFLAIEAIKGRPVNKALQERLVQVCFVMLMGLMVFIMWNDINKYFLSEWLDKEPGKPQQTQPNDSQSPQKSTVQAHPATESVR